MDENAFGVIAVVVILAVAVVGVVVAVPAAYYLSDGVVEATVIGKQCGLSPTGKTSRVTVETQFPVPGITHTMQQFPNDKCSLVNKDNYVEYRVRSERTTLYQREGGACIYDTKTGVACR